MTPEIEQALLRELDRLGGKSRAGTTLAERRAPLDTAVSEIHAQREFLRAARQELARLEARRSDMLATLGAHEQAKAAAEERLTAVARQAAEEIVAGGEVPDLDSLDRAARKDLLPTKRIDMAERVLAEVDRAIATQNAIVRDGIGTVKAAYLEACRIECSVLEGELVVQAAPLFAALADAMVRAGRPGVLPDSDWIAAIARRSRAVPAPAAWHA